MIEESDDAPETIEDADELQSDENNLPPVAVDDAQEPQLDDTLPIRFTPTPTRARMGANRI